MMKSLNDIKAEAGAKKEVSIKDTEVTKCECGSETFMPATKWGSLSPVHPANDSGQPVMIQFPTWVCTECGVEPKQG